MIRPLPPRLAAVLTSVALVALGALGACGEGPAGPPSAARARPKTRPSVALICVSGLRQDVFAEIFPAPAPDVLRFREAYSTAGWSMPAIASSITGMTPADAGGVALTNGTGFPRLLAPPLKLAEMLAEEGYDTVAFAAPTALPPGTGFEQGVRGGWHAASTPTGPVDGALAWLAARTSTSPFFLWVVLDVDAFDPEAPEAPAATSSPDDGPRVPSLRAAHAARLRVLEAGVTRLREALRGCLGADGLTFVHSDGGVGFGDDGAPAGSRGGVVTDARLRARLELSGPGFPPGAHDGSCSILDILPTVRHAMGLPPYRGLAGHALQPLAADPTHPGLPVVAQEWREDDVDGRAVERQFFAVRTATWKWTAVMTLRPVGWTEHLFHLAEDPTEASPRPMDDLKAGGPRFAAAVGRVRDFLSGRRDHLNDEILGGYLGR